MDWLKILIVALILLSIYLVVSKIFGHSPTELQISITLFLTLFAYLYNINREFNKFRSWTKIQMQSIKTETEQTKKNIETIRDGVKMLLKKS